MKRIGVYITNVSVKDGPVLHSRPGEKSRYITTESFDNWFCSLSTELMIPNESFSFTLCSDVKLNTLIRDEESDTFYDFNQEIITDRLIGLTVRQFITDNIINIDKTIKFKGFVLADLEF